MNAAQDWCLQCGAGAPGSLAITGGGWRSTGAVIGASAVLALGAAAAAYAALNKGGARSHVLRTAAAQNAVPAPVTPAPVTPAPVVPGAVPTPGAPATGKGAVPTVPVLPGAGKSLKALKPPKIPLAASTPSPAATPKLPVVGNSPNFLAKTTPPAASGGSSPSAEPQPKAILLDTNAAATYNPYAYPATDFGDPSLAIDGDTTTAWTAQLEPTVAPKMAEGLVVDLKTARRLSAIVLVTSTPGMTIQLYGANGKTLPASILDPKWVKLSSSVVEKKKRVQLKLRNSKRAFRFVTLWISNAPATSVGTPQAPGHVSVAELELLPAS
ncbi:MAG: hypothetical protein QOI03_584 [Solirubrobacteraceae bacterium]|nr:hypothetical protein [Solirubrobacteraceae bacterium]